MNGFRVRAGVREDVPSILRIYNDAVLHTTATYDYEPRTLEHRLQWFDDHEAQRYPIFVAINDQEQLVGWSSLNRYHDRIGYRFTTENSVYVDLVFRGRGVGTLLMPPLIEGATTRGLHAILASIDAQNESSIRLHAKFGFEKVGLFRRVGYKFGRWLDVMYMERLIQENAEPK